MRRAAPIFLLLGFTMLGAQPGFTYTPDDFLAKIKALSFTCRTPQQLAKDIYYCSENDQAVDSAESCRAALKQLWDQAPQELKQVYSVARKEILQRQEKKFDDTQSDYKKTMAKLDQLIAATKRNADIVAQYPRAMVDVPGVDWDPSRSAPCYNDRFAEIQKIVTKLDEMAEQGEVARAQASGLQKISTHHDGSMSSAGNESSIKGRPSRVTPVAPSGNHPYRESDVTGLKDEEDKDKLNLSNKVSPPAETLDLKKMKNESDPEWVDSFLDQHDN